MSLARFICVCVDIDVIQTTIISFPCQFILHVSRSTILANKHHPLLFFPICGFFLLLEVVFKLNHALGFLLGFFFFTLVFPKATKFMDLGNRVNMKLDCPYEMLLISQEARLCTSGLRKGKITDGRVLQRAVCVHIMDKYWNVET